MEIQRDAVQTGLNTSVGVAAWGYTLNEWVAILTGIYLVLQIVYMICKFVMLRRGRVID